MAKMLQLICDTCILKISNRRNKPATSMICGGVKESQTDVHNSYNRLSLNLSFVVLSGKQNISHFHFALQDNK